MSVAPGATSQSFTVQVVNDAGMGVTGLVAATFPATSYERVAEALAAITIVDLASLTAAYSSGGVFEVGGGYYRLDVPNAAFATASTVRIIGEASGKHVIYPPIEVATLAVTLTSAYDLWTADVKLNRDDVNSKDEWTCIVSKNGVVQDTLTAVSIRIGHRDGTAFIGSTAMTAGSDSITWRKDFTTSNRLTAGEDVAVFITATDSLSAQHVCKVIAPITGRDSTT